MNPSPSILYHLPKVDEADASIVEDEDISGMGVSVEEAPLEHCAPKGLRQCREELLAKELSLRPIRIDPPCPHQLECTREGLTLEVIHHEHALRDESSDGQRRHQRRGAWRALGARVECVVDPAHRGGFCDEIELVAQLRLNLREDNVVIDRDGVDTPHARSERLDRLHIAQELRLDRRTLLVTVGESKKRAVTNELTSDHPCA